MRIPATRTAATDATTPTIDAAKDATNTNAREAVLAAWLAVVAACAACACTIPARPHACSARDNAFPDSPSACLDCLTAPKAAALASAISGLSNALACATALFIIVCSSTFLIFSTSLLKAANSAAIVAQQSAINFAP